MGKTNSQPYFGMTGTMLNVWVTVACTTAMTLFGERSLSDICSAVAHFMVQVTIRAFLAALSSLTIFWRQWGIQTPIFRGLLSLCTTLDGKPSVRIVIKQFSDNLFSSFVGAMCAFLWGERLGRKKTFMIGVVIMSIGAILQTCAFGVTQMIVARLITGEPYENEMRTLN